MKLNYIKHHDYKIPIFIQDRKKDTTVLFLHGLNSNSDFMEKILDHSYNFNIVALNFPGSKYFRKISAEEITLEWWIEVANIVIDNIKTKNIVVVAHSMSGGVAVKIANNDRIKKMIMLSSFNPSMIKRKSYGILHSVIKPKGMFSKLFGKLTTTFLSMSKKNVNLIEGFTKKGRWTNLLMNYVLNEEYIKTLENDYLSHKDKMLFVIGQKDGIIGTDEYIKYAQELQIFSCIMGSTHSPIKTASREITELLNFVTNSKKRIFPRKFVTFTKNVDEFFDNYGIEKEQGLPSEEELLDQIDQSLTNIDKVE